MTHLHILDESTPSKVAVSLKDPHRLKTPSRAGPTNPHGNRIDTLYSCSKNNVQQRRSKFSAHTKVTKEAQKPLKLF